MKTQRGQSTVELVLLMPLLLVMFFLIFEIGRVFGSWLLITNAANEGARFGAVQCVPSQTCTGTDPTASIVQQVHNTASFLDVQTATYCSASGDPVPNGTTSCALVNWSTDNSVSVVVAYRVETLMPITGYVPFIGNLNYPGYFELIAVSKMHTEQ